MKIIIKKQNRAFTLIETLVAITILMIAIAGPLTVASKGLTSALDAKNQSVAINLAQEGLEYINNMKDNKTWGAWFPGTDFEDMVNIDYRKCTVEFRCEFGNELSPVYPGFSRNYYFAIHRNSDQIRAVVEVSWNTGTLSGSLTLDQILTNYER